MRRSVVRAALGASRKRHGEVRAHAARVRPAVAVEQALVILQAGQHDERLSPSVMAKTESSSPSMNSSTSTSAPAAPKRLPSRMSSMARSASSSELQMITPFPLASPDALITTGAPEPADRVLARWRRRYASRRAPWESPSSSMSCLANAFDVSISAAAFVGPKIGSPASRNRSTIPAARGASGPTTVRSTARSRASFRSAGEVGDGGGNALGQLGDSRIARRREQFEGGFFLPELPGEGVLATAAADDQDAHMGAI